jgi:uncharacterized protein (DUF58 family)
MNVLNKEMETSTKQRVRFWAVLSCFVFSLFFFLFQGGKLASLVFVVVSALCLYLLLGRWSGITQSKGARTILGTESNTTVSAGAQLAVQISVQIPGFWPVPYVFVKDRLIRKGGEEYFFESSVIPDWKRHGELSYRTVPLRRGVYYFGQTDCSTEDIFGLFQHRGVMDIPNSFKVLPQMIKLNQWAGLNRMVRGLQSHSSTTRSYREMTQINGVREYNYGDRLSRIHWNATAKTGTLKSKEFERESLPRTILLLDRNMKSYPNPEDFELAVSITASLADYFHSRDLAVGLLSVGKDTVYIDAKRGRGQFQKILDHLIETEADGKFPLIEVLKDRSRYFQSGMFINIISPLYENGLQQSLLWIEQRQMNPCHLWVAPHASESARDQWKKQLRLNNYLGYSIKQLQDLPKVLGGNGA